MSIGISLTALTKIIRTAANEDILTIKKDDDGDSLGLVFEGSSEYLKHGSLGTRIEKGA